MIISRYLAREVTYALLGITSVLLAVFLSQQLIRYLNYVAVGKIPTDVLFHLIGFEIPSLLALLLPLSLFLGVLIAYGRLYADNEMAIMHMGGFNRRELLRFTGFLATIISMLVLFLMLWINPLLALKKEKLTSNNQASDHLIQTLVPGRFQVSNDGHRVMYVEKLSRDRLKAENVFSAQQKVSKEAENANPWVLISSEQGYSAKDKVSGNQFFVSANGYRYEGSPGSNDYKITQFKKYSLRLPQTENQVNHNDNETLSSATLLNEYKNPLKAAELQWRISIGVSTFLLALLAVLLSAVQPRRGRFLALIPAIFVYIIYYNLLIVARHLVESNTVPIFLGMWWVHILMLFLIIAVMFNYQKNWGR